MDACAVASIATVETGTFKGGGDAPGDVCPAGTEPISSFCECKAAALALGKTFKGETSLVDYTPGCSERIEHPSYTGVWFNTNLGTEYDGHNLVGQTAPVCEESTTSSPCTPTMPAWAKLCDQWPGDQKRKKLKVTSASDVEACQEECDKISDCHMLYFVHKYDKYKPKYAACKLFQGVDAPDPTKCAVSDRRRKAVVVTHFKCKHGRGADGHCLSAFVRPCSTTTTTTPCTATLPAWAKLCDQWPGDQKKKWLLDTTASDVEGCQEQCDKISDCHMLLFVYKPTYGGCKLYQGIDSPETTECAVSDRRRKSVAATHFKCKHGRGAGGNCLSAFVRPCPLETTTTTTATSSPCTATMPAWAKLCDQWPGDQKRKRLLSTTASDVEGCQDQCDKISDCRMILFVHKPYGGCKLYQGVDSPDPIICDVADRRRKSVASTHFKCEHGRGADGDCLSAFVRPCPTTTEIMVEPLERWVANHQVTLEPFEHGAPLRAMSQQAVSTPGVRFDNLAVEKGASYEFSVAGKSSRANAYQWVEGCGRDIVPRGPRLPTSLSRVTTSFTVPLDCSTDTVNLGVLWSDPAVGDTMELFSYDIHRIDLREP